MLSVADASSVESKTGDLSSSAFVDTTAMRDKVSRGPDNVTCYPSTRRTKNSCLAIMFSHQYCAPMAVIPKINSTEYSENCHFSKCTNGMCE
jgi:hypothetical protein